MKAASSPPANTMEIARLREESSAISAAAKR